MTRWTLIAFAAVVLTIAILLAVVHRPILSRSIITDDFDWAALAARALDRPSLLLADLDGFYRPTTTWSVAFEQWIFGRDAEVHRAGTLTLHAVAAIVFALVAFQLLRSWWLAGAVGLLWALSPFTVEPAVAVACRLENFLFLAWSVLILAWPRRGESFTPPRRTLVVLSIAFAALSKETWVVTPILVGVLAYNQHGVEFSKLAPPFLITVIAATVYTLAHFALLPAHRGYFLFDLSLLKRVPHMCAAFSLLQPLSPSRFPLTAVGIVALFAIGVVAWLAWSRARSAVAIGLVLLFAPGIPTAFVPYLPSRYLAIPFAGFVLLVAAAVVAAQHRLSARARPLFMAASVVTFLTVLATFAAEVRSDLRDYTRVAEATEWVVAEARELASILPRDLPVLIVRNEQVEPLHQIVDQNEGTEKVWFVRAAHAYGLVDTAALLTWVDPNGGTWRRAKDPETAFTGVHGRVVVHNRGGFVLAPGIESDLGKAMARWKGAGRRFTVVMADANSDDVAAGEPPCSGGTGWQSVDNPQGFSTGYWGAQRQVPADFVVAARRSLRYISRLLEPVDPLARATDGQPDSSGP